MNPNQPQGNFPPPLPPQPYASYPVPSGAPPPMPVSANSQKPGKRWKLIVALVVCILLLLGSLVFGIWAFAERQDYKHNSDIKAAQAAELAKQAESTRKDAEFTEKEKSPTKTYLGPEAYGSVTIQYPKTWSAYIVQTDRSTLPLDAYFHPNFVPSVQQTGQSYALRLQITNQPYDQELRQFEGNVKAGKLTSTPFTPKNVPGAAGVRLDGELSPTQRGSMVLLPLRDKTIKISTESSQFTGDFDLVILPNLKFIP